MTVDVSIGLLHLVGRVVGSARPGPRADIVDQLTGKAAQERVLEALTSAFDGEEVLVIRSLACRATLRADARAGPDALARSIATSACRLMRDHPSDDDCVVRFPDEAAYVAAYIHDRLDGHHHRWYFDAFEPYRRGDGSTDWGALLAAHRDRRWRILTQVRRNGDLETLLTAVGEDGARDLVTDLTDEEVGGWAPLVATAAEIVGRATGASPTTGPELTTALAAAEPPPDWLDPASLGGAIAAAAAGLLTTPDTAPAGEPGIDPAPVAAAARQHEWFDPDAFEDGISRRRQEHDHPSPAQRGPHDDELDRLSPRSRQVLADLSEAAGDPRLRLDADRPGSAANLIRLFAALVHRAPRWHDDELARSLTAHVLRRWEQAVFNAAAPVPADTWAGTTSAATMPAPPGPPARPGSPAWPMPSPAGSAASPQHDGHGQGEHPTAARGGEAADHRSTHRSVASPRSVAAQLDVRFPHGVQHGARRRSAAAVGLLLLRSLLDLGLSWHVLGSADGDREPVLAALLRRWAGRSLRQDAADPLLALAGGLTCEGSPATSGIDAVCHLAARRLLGQRLALAPFQLVTVPYAEDELATTMVDASQRVLPLGSLDGPDGLRESISAVDPGLVPDPVPAGTEAQASVADGLCSVAAGGMGSGDRQRELLLDLLAISCVQAWARWLPGFADARVAFLLSTVVRRPADVEIDPTEITVYLPSRPYDIVLDLAGYLEPVEAGAALGGRGVRFVTGDQHAR
jgi:hypothetical protein